eukprot:1024422-Pleurochrysis_carterae.AAC.2
MLVCARAHACAPESEREQAHRVECEGEDGQGELQHQRLHEGARRAVVALEACAARRNKQQERDEAQVDGDACLGQTRRATQTDPKEIEERKRRKLERMIERGREREQGRPREGRKGWERRKRVCEM